MGAWLGRKAKPELKLGVCGEHGGDPDSIAFFHRPGIDYVSLLAVPRADRAGRRAQAAIRALVTTSAARAPDGRLVWRCENGAREPPCESRESEFDGPPARVGGARWLVAARPRARTRPRGQREEADCGAAHAVPARPRPDRALQGVPAAQAQDAGVRRARGRPLPHAADAHARGHADLAHGRAGAAPQRGPRRGDRPRATTSATRPSATSARRCSTRCLRERFGRALPPLRALAARGRRARGRSTSPRRCATASCGTPAARRMPATLEGRIVRLVDRDRLHQPRHRRRAARRRARAGDLPAGAIAVLGDSGLAAHRHARPRPRRALRAGRRHRAGRRGRRRRWPRCATSCSSASTSARRRAPSTRKIERVIRGAVRPLLRASGRAACAAVAGGVRTADRARRPTTSPA